MNANELADELDELHEQDKADGVAHLAMPEAATMLRQQQAEIAALKYEKSSGVYDFEPVAWAREDGVIAFHKQKEVDSQGFKWFPLYNHPAKTLTDEEIKQIFQEQTGFFFDDNPADDLALMDFARAILRKTQEK